MNLSVIKTTGLIFAVVCAIRAAVFGILIEKTSPLYQAPLEGIKTVVGPGETSEYDMNEDSAAGKTACLRFKSEGCSVILAIGKGAARTAMNSGAGLPVVYCMVMGPDAAGLKGASVTGVSLDVPMSRQFESFKNTVPSLKKVGLVYSDDLGAALVKEMKAASLKTGLSLVEKKVAGDAEVPGAIREMRGKIDGLYLPPDRVVARHDAFQFIALFTFENNLPFMAPTDRFVKKGALVALMIDYEEVGKQAGQLAKKIAAGAAVSSVPPEPPQVTILVLNQKTAQTIGMNIPPALLQGSMIIK
jgi:putative ABC transport system substrate-binding protein